MAHGQQKIEPWQGHHFLDITVYLWSLLSLFSDSQITNKSELLTILMSKILSSLVATNLKTQNFVSG